MLDLGQHMVNTGVGGIVGTGAGAGLGALFAKLASKKYPTLGYAIPTLGGAALGGLSGAMVGASVKPKLTPYEEQQIVQALQQGQY